MGCEDGSEEPTGKGKEEVSAKSQHVLERRANALAQHMKVRITDVATALQAADGRIPFHTKLSKGDALDWWAKHRYDSLGQKALQGLPPQAVFSLDAALNQRVAQQQETGLPVEGAPDQQQAQSQSFDLSHLGLQPSGPPTQAGQQQLDPDMLAALFGAQQGGQNGPPGNVPGM